MCRGQGYDIAPTMAGVYSGVQATICELNLKALFVPCKEHFMNMCGIHSFPTVPFCIIVLVAFLSFYAQIDDPSDKC